MEFEVVCIVYAEPFPTVCVAPFTVKLPPSVVNPVPVVIGLLVVVLRERVVADVKSMIGDEPVKLKVVAGVERVTALRVSLLPAAPLRGEMVMFPVVAPPKVKLLFVRDCIVPVEASVIPLPELLPDVAEMEAVGLFVALVSASPVTANLAKVAEFVAVPPKRKSSVLLIG